MSAEEIDSPRREDLLVGMRDLPVQMAKGAGRVPRGRLSQKGDEELEDLNLLITEVPRLEVEDEDLQSLREALESVPHSEVPSDLGEQNTKPDVQWAHPARDDRSASVQRKKKDDWHHEVRRSFRHTGRLERKSMQGAGGRLGRSDYVADDLREKHPGNTRDGDCIPDAWEKALWPVQGHSQGCADLVDRCLGQEDGSA